MESDEEDSDENEKNLNNDMSDLKEDNDSSDEEELNSVTKEGDVNKSEVFALKLKKKKVVMDEARKQLPYTFTGNDCINKLLKKFL